MSADARPDLDELAEKNMHGPGLSMHEIETLLRYAAQMRSHNEGWSKDFKSLAEKLTAAEQDCRRLEQERDQCALHVTDRAESDCIYCDHEDEQMRANAAEQRVRDLEAVLRDIESNYDHEESGGHRPECCRCCKAAAALEPR